MAAELLTSKEAARRLGVSVSQFYEWLRLSNAGELRFCGHAVTIDYFQGGPKGQGRIRIDAAEVERLLEFMRVRPRTLPIRKPIVRHPVYPGITAELGRPGHVPIGRRASSN
jgi:hypothetical protein